MLRSPDEGDSCTMDEAIIDHALSRIHDDTTICNWATEEVARRLGRADPQDYEFWATYTVVVTELLEAIRPQNGNVASIRPFGDVFIPNDIRRFSM
jgi:hypothetical protein